MKVYVCLQKARKTLWFFVFNIKQMQLEGEQHETKKMDTKRTTIYNDNVHIIHISILYG